MHGMQHSAADDAVGVTVSSKQRFLSPFQRSTAFACCCVAWRGVAQL
jgi:hypothetical protein